MNRRKNTPKRVSCAAMIAVAIAYQRRAKVKIDRLPNLSAMNARAMVPTKRPANVTDAKLAWSVSPKRPFSFGLNDAATDEARGHLSREDQVVYLEESADRQQ